MPSGQSPLVGMARTKTAALSKQLQHMATWKHICTIRIFFTNFFVTVRCFMVKKLTLLHGTSENTLALLCVQYNHLLPLMLLAKLFICPHKALPWLTLTCCNAWLVLIFGVNKCSSYLTCVSQNGKTRETGRSEHTASSLKIFLNDVWKWLTIKGG